ncbi:MAG: ATP-binding protein [Myxococcota bacterium]|nr:ATP-binding protein [Myxococcota bacterium]
MDGGIPSAGMRTLLAALADPVIGYGGDGTCRYLNPAAEATVTRELLGRRLWDVYPGLRDSEFGRAFDEALETGGPVRHRSRYEPTGMDYEATLVGVDGWVIVTFRDVTEALASAHRTRQLGSLARASELLGSDLDTEHVLDELMRLVVPELADWCTVDLYRGGRLVRISVAHRDPSKVALGFEIAERWPMGPAESPLLARVMAGETVVVRDIDGAALAQMARGPEHLAILREIGLGAVVACPLVRPERPLGLICFASEGERTFDDTDVTVARELARRAATALHLTDLLVELREERDRAEEAVRVKDDFLAVLGHELRNPLAPIRTAVEVLGAEPRFAEVKEMAIIDRQLRHVTQLVDDLLDVARITRGTMELLREPIDLADALQAAIEMASPLVDQRGHTLEIRAPAGAWVDGDARRLAQVFSNLLTNAARYTPRGGTIEVAGAVVGDRVQVAVRDDGRGISPDSLPRLFRPFERIEPSGADGGLGLGLSIVRGLVEKHGGDITIESDGVGRGTTVTVRLPLLPSEGRVARAPSPSRERRADVRGRVLLVDDNEDAALLLAVALRKRGFEVVVAHDGPAALELLDGPLHAAILDLGLPVMDGVELGTRIRERLGDAAPPLVALTGYGQRGARDRTTAAGFAAHLVKPVEIAALVELLRGLVAR